MPLQYDLFLLKTLSERAAADTIQQYDSSIRTKARSCVAGSWNSGSKLSGCMLLSSPRFAFKGKHSPYSTALEEENVLLLHTTTAVVRGTFTMVNFKSNKRSFL